MRSPFLITTLALCLSLLRLSADIVLLSDYWDGNPEQLSSAFDEAVHDAGSGGTVKLGRRNYVTDRALTLSSNVHVLGQGGARSRFEYVGEEEATVLTVDGTGMTLAGFGIDGGGSANVGVDVLDGAGVTLRDIRVRSLSDSDSIGILAIPTNEAALRIEFCRLEGFSLSGLYLDGQSQGEVEFLVEQNYFVQGGEDFVPEFGIVIKNVSGQKADDDGVSASVVTGNYVEPMSVASLAVSNSSNLHITENEFLGGEDASVVTQAVLIGDFSSEVSLTENLLSDAAEANGVNVGTYQEGRPSYGISIENNAFLGTLNAAVVTGADDEVTIGENVFESAEGPQVSATILQLN